MQRPGQPRPGRPSPEAKPAWPSERHSGEGSASALETLQKLESDRRLPEAPPEPEAGADDVPSP